MTILSKVFPKYPANAPMSVPIAPAMITEINPILREILAPKIILENISLPKLSVPIKFLIFGEVKAASGCCSEKVYGAT